MGEGQQKAPGQMTGPGYEKWAFGRLGHPNVREIQGETDTVWEEDRELQACWLGGVDYTARS
jgi:hypothetical protein